MVMGRNKVKVKYICTGEHFLPLKSQLSTKTQ